MLIFIKSILEFLFFTKLPKTTTPFFFLLKFYTNSNISKSSIDTPGVISRVSTLFRGHNNLIQGFNTFLPPGYRIECSMDPSDPNPIRVTTPRGTTSRPEGDPGAYDNQWQQQQPQAQNQQSPQQNPQEHYPGYGMQGRGVPMDANNAGSMNQLHEAASDNRQVASTPVVESRRPGDPVEFNYAISYVNKIKTRFANQPEIYNSFLEILQTYHREQLRINEVYVQVTQLFKDAPDLLDDFKQFLPDMSQQGPQQGISPQQQQQQQQQPIHHVPPHSISQQQNMGPASDNVRLPPVGNFSPPTIGSSGMPNPPAGALGPHGQPAVGMVPPPAQSTPSGRAERKKRGNTASNSQSAAQASDAMLYQQQQQQQQIQQQQMYQQQQIQQNPSGPGTFDMGPTQISNSRATSGPKKSRVRGDAPLSPTLVPATPEPLITNSNLDNGVLMEEISFFDKAKRFISNKQTYNEFLKVLNLFSQRIIDKNLLVERVEGFLGGNRELMNWFKDFVKYDGKPLHIENIPYKKHLIELSLCRSYGRSYRLLPKSEPYMPCSGRDEMCWEVLNDEWVGHPVWASEEAGFVAHRKNQYEEIMHRVEEERHEYDYYIEANLRSIQTLETLASRIANMSPEEKTAFRLPPNLGHTSTIYEKVLKKIYGENRYHEVVDALRETPAVAVPIVLRRMKQKDEEWKRAHREWNKVWRDTEQKVFFKSLDHRGLTFKQTDKKYLTTRQLVSEITTVKTEQSNKRVSPLQPKPKEQLVYDIKDYSVLGDLVRIVMCFLGHSSSYSSNDRERMELFFKSFLRLFFSLPEGIIPFPTDNDEQEEKSEEGGEAEINGTVDPSPAVNGSASAANGSANPDPDSKSSSSSSKKRSRESSGELLRDILKKSKQAKRFRDDVPPTEDDEDAEEEEEDPIERAGELWLRHLDSTLNLFEERPRDTFNMFANNTVYVFMRLLIILYERLEEVKLFESTVSDEIANSRNVEFAIDLDLYDHRMSDMGLAFDSKDCYGQVLNLVERLIEGDLEHQWYEESIRQAYRNRAYKLYTVDKVAQAVVKHLHNIVSDAKSSDVLVLWEHDRENPLTSTKEQILYRMRVKSILGSDENMFRIEWNNKERKAMIQFLGTEDLTLKQKRSEEESWNYYLTSYLIAGPTEGVLTEKVRVPFLQRNLTDESIPDNASTTSENPEKEGEEVSADGGADYIDIIDQGLTARIALPTYRLFFEPSTEDYFSRKVGVSTNSSTKIAEEQRVSRWRSFVNGSNGWKKGLDESASAEAIARYNAWKNDKPLDGSADGQGLIQSSSSNGALSGSGASGHLSVTKDNDVTMSDLSAVSATSSASADLTKSVIEPDGSAITASDAPVLQDITMDKTIDEIDTQKKGDSFSASISKPDGTNDSNTSNSLPKPAGDVEMTDVSNEPSAKTSQASVPSTESASKRSSEPENKPKELADSGKDNISPGSENSETKKANEQEKNKSTVDSSSNGLENQSSDGLKQQLLNETKTETDTSSKPSTTTTSDSNKSSDTKSIDSTPSTVNSESSSVSTQQPASNETPSESKSENSSSDNTTSIKDKTEESLLSSKETPTATTDNDKSNNNTTDSNQQQSSSSSSTILNDDNKPTTTTAPSSSSSSSVSSTETKKESSTTPTNDKDGDVEMKEN